MTVLLRIYDNIASNKNVSFGTTIAATGFMAYRSIRFISQECKWYSDSYDYFQRHDREGLYAKQHNIFHIMPITFLVSLCAGISLALISNTYLAGNKEVKSDEERNNIHTTLSLFTALMPVHRNAIYQQLFKRQVEGIGA